MNNLEFSHLEQCYDSNGYMFLKEWFYTPEGKLVWFTEHTKSAGAGKPSLNGWQYQVLLCRFVTA